MVEIAKRILTKEKVDRLLARQSSSTPFMSVRDSYNQMVTLNTQDGLEDKIDKLIAMIGKLVARDNEVNRPCKSQYKGAELVGVTAVRVQTAALPFVRV